MAAAIAYGLGRPQEADTILVVDLGGGTLDISILESFEVRTRLQEASLQGGAGHNGVTLHLLTFSTSASSRASRCAAAVAKQAVATHSQHLGDDTKPLHTAQLVDIELRIHLQASGEPAAL